MEATRENDVSVDLLRAEARRAKYIKEFESWTCSRFRQALIGAEFGTPDAGELVDSFRPWLEKLIALASEGALVSLSPADAAKLRSLLDHVLDGLELCYHYHGFSGAELWTTLGPVEDVLTFLAFKQRASEKILSGERIVSGGAHV